MLALIGPPGAGKSSCLVCLGIDRSEADMDAAIGGQAPALEAALTWLRNNTQPVVVVGAHEMLSELVEAVRRDDSGLRVCFVYLRKSRELLTTHLACQRVEGNYHDEATQRDALDRYDELDQRFRALADCTIECGEGIDPTVSAVRAMLSEMGTGSGDSTAGRR